MQSQTHPNLCYQTPTPRRQHRTLAKRQTSTSPPPQHHAEHPVAPVPARTRGHGPGRSPSPTSTASHQNLTPNPRPPHPRELLPSIAHQEGGFLFLAWQGTLPNSKNTNRTLGRKGCAYKNHHSCQNRKITREPICSH